MENQNYVRIISELEFWKKKFLCYRYMKLRTTIFNLERNKMVLTIKTTLWGLVIDHYFWMRSSVTGGFPSSPLSPVNYGGKDSKVKALHSPLFLFNYFFNTLSKCHPYRQRKQIVLIFFLDLSRIVLLLPFQYFVPW